MPFIQIKSSFSAIFANFNFSSILLIIKTKPHTNILCSFYIYILKKNVLRLLFCVKKFFQQVQYPPLGGGSWMKYFSVECRFNLQNKAEYSKMCSVLFPNELRFHPLNVVLFSYNVLSINWGVVVETFYSNIPFQPSKCSRSLFKVFQENFKSFFVFQF